jgi:hypothetical protein
MARELRLARETLRSVDPYFSLDEDFFSKHVPTVVERHIFDKILGTLPAESDPMDASSVVDKGEMAYKAMAGIHASAMVRHSVPALGKAVNGAMMIARAMLDGESLAAIGAHNSSEFHRHVYRLCGNYLVYSFVKPVKILGASTVRYVYGLAAMKEHVKELDNAVAGTRPIELGALKLFRQFRWLLTPDEDIRIQKLIMVERHKRQNLLEGRMLQDCKVDSDIGDGMGEAKPTSSAIVSIGLEGQDGSISGTVGLLSTSSSSAHAPASKKTKTSDPGVEARLALFLPKWVASKGKKS